MSDRIMDKSSRLQELVECFVKELPSRLDDIQQEWHAFQVSGSGREFHRLVHNLAGSAGTFGFPQLGERARELELLIQALVEGPIPAESITVIEQTLLGLREMAEREADHAGASNEHTAMPVASDEQQVLVYLLEDDVTLAAEIARQLQHFDYRVEVFHRVDALQEGVARQLPGVLLADIHLPEGMDAGPQVASELCRDAEVPVIFISGYDTWQDRLNAVRAGGQAYLTKPINFTLLFDELDAVIGNQTEAAYRILIVDDTPLLAEHYAAVLQAVGMQTEILNNPAQIFETLADFHPDLVLMDVYMPKCSGVEAAHVIRQHALYTNLPIVYLSTEKALDQQLEALRVGGDDFLQKPISDTHLVAAVRIRARRFRELAALMNRDSLTGLLNHINLKLALERELAQAQRRSSLISFVMLDIDHFKSVNDSYGHPVGDRVIKSLARLLSQRLRKGDIAARYGGEEFALILLDTGAEDASQLINALRQQFAQITHSHEKGDFSVTFSAGIATYPPHVKMDLLIAAADDALYQAKHAGRNQIVVDMGGAGRKASD